MTSGKQSDRYESIFREGLFDGRVVLITGGGSGIGRCTAHELAALGAQVVIAGRRKELLDETAQEISECGGKCDVVQMDIRDEENVDAGVAEVVSRHSRIDGLFNNAGGQFVSPAANMSPKGWRTVIDLNLNGTFIVTHAVFQHSMKVHGGSIVCMLADIGTGYPGMAHMSAARAGIQNLTISLALEWGSAGVQVNCVAPGTILSSGMKHYPPEIQERACREARDLTSARLGTEGEVAAAVTFLMSPAAGYVTGETIRVDGGSLFHKGRLMEVGRHDRARAWNGFHLQHDFSGTPFADLLKASEQD